MPGAVIRDFSKLGIHNQDDADNEEAETPIRPSAKALGKRRQIDPPESERKLAFAQRHCKDTDD